MFTSSEEGLVTAVPPDAPLGREPNAEAWALQSRIAAVQARGPGLFVLFTQRNVVCRC